MTTTVTLSEDDIAAAIGALLRERGFQINGKVMINHYAGDMREPSTTTASVQVEPLGRAGQ
jgi:hypothetical protein